LDHTHHDEGDHHDLGGVEAGNRAEQRSTDAVCVADAPRRNVVVEVDE
jgi:hypothetical protein